MCAKKNPIVLLIAIEMAVLSVFWAKNGLGPIEIKYCLLTKMISYL